MRLNMSENEFKKIADVLYKNDIEIYNIFIASKDKTFSFEAGTNKMRAAEKARDIRTKKTKQKIQSAYNIMKLENKKINLNSLSKASNVSPITIKSYAKSGEFSAVEFEKYFI